MAYNFTDKSGLIYAITKIKNLLSNYLDKSGDSKDNTVTFTSGDSTNPTGWASISLVESGETHASMFRKFSLAVKNLRYLYKMLGSTDISSIGDGTITGAISTQNSNLEKSDMICKTVKTNSNQMTFMLNYSADSYERLPVMVLVTGQGGYIGLYCITAFYSKFYINTINGVDATIADNGNGTVTITFEQSDIWGAGLVIAPKSII